LETFIPQAASAHGFDPQQPIPFLLKGRVPLIEFHVLNRLGDEAHDPEKHKRIQVTFHLTNKEMTIVGFFSRSHRGIFTPMDSSIHMHFQSLDNSSSGHIQTLEIGPDVVLHLPRNSEARPPEPGRLR